MRFFSKFTQERRVIIAVLFILVLAGGFLRLYQLSFQSYWIGEAYTINAVLSIQEKGHSTLDSGYYYSCPLYCYPAAYIAEALGNSPFTYRLFAALAGILMIIIIFFVSRRMFNVRVALLTSFFTAFSYWQIAWSRQARWYTLLEVFFWLSILFFHQSVSNKKYQKLWIALTVFFTILTIKTNNVGLLLPFIFLGWIIFVEFFIKKDFDWLRVMRLATGGIAVLLLLDYLFKISAYVISQVDYIYLLPYYLNFYIRNYWLFIPFLVLALIFGSLLEKRNSWFLFLIFIVYLLPLSLLTPVMHYRYLFHATPILFMVGAAGMVYVFDYLKTKRTKIIYVSLILLLFFTIGGGVLIPRNMYFLESDNWETLGRNRDYYPVTPQPNWNAAYGVIQAKRSPNDIVISNIPAFNKIFLNEPGYWIQHKYLGEGDEGIYFENGRERYAGAIVIHDFNEFKELTSTHHGYVVLDHMGVSNNKISKEILNLIKTQFKLVFYEKTNSYSYIMVYKF